MKKKNWRLLKEAGVESLKSEEKLTVKKKDLPEDKARVVVLKPSIN